jgi:hypothetical protein
VNSLSCGCSMQKDSGMLPSVNSLSCGCSMQKDLVRLSPYSQEREKREDKIARGRGICIQIQRVDF